MKNFSWQTHEYVHKEKSQDWFWVVGIAAGALAITSIILGNILFAVVVVIGAFVLSLFAARKPGIITVEINDKAVLIENTLYPFKDLKSFWIDMDHFDGPRLVLECKKTLLPHVMVPIDEEIAETIKPILTEKIPFVVFEEHPGQNFLERIGF